MSDVQITLSTEQCVHKALASFAKTVYEDYGISLDSVQFKWMEVKTPKEVGKILIEVTSTQTANVGFF